MSFYPTKNLSSEEKNQMQIDFDELFSTSEGRDKLWFELKKSFSILSPQDIFNFSESYTRWFALVSWKKFITLSLEDALFVVDKVLLSGIFLDQEPWQSILDYLNLKTLDQVDMSDKYSQLKEKILNSQEIITKRADGSFYRISDLAKELKKANVSKDDLGFANIISNLSSFVGDRLNKLSLEAEKTTDFVATFKACLDFLLGVEKDTIWYMVDALNYPVQYESEPGENLAPVEVIDNEEVTDSEFLDIEKTLDEIVEQDLAEQESSSEVEEGEIILSQNVIEDIPNIYQEIKTNFEQKYLYDENGELSPIEDVLADLAQMAEERGNENIEDLYFFDENSGKFVWNEDLTGGNA